MKRRRENRREEDYFVIKAGLDGHEASLALEIPSRLYNSFSCQFQSSGGVEKLNEFFFAYTDLSKEQKEIFQFSIYDVKNELRDFDDLFCLLKAFKRTFVR